MKDKNKTLVRFFKAIASEERIEMLNLIKDKELCASDIEKHFFMEQSTASHHLNTLKRAGAVKIRKDGRKVFYSLNREGVEDAFRKLMEELG